MMKPLEIGIRHIKKHIVLDSDSAASMDSGTLPVYATPAMIRLMESTARESIQDSLDPGVASVGTKVCVSHLSPTPIGAQVTCETLLIEIDGAKLAFSVKVVDSSGLIGEGTHERHLINIERFMEKTNRKLTNCPDESV